MNQIAGGLKYPFEALPAHGESMRVAPGIRWLRMRLPFALDHINVWLLDDDEALAAVDCGFALDDSRAHWQAVLQEDRRPLRRILVTHHHPDHLGLATWLAARDQAQVLLTQGEFLAAHAVWHQLPGYCVADMLVQFRRHGLDEERLAALEARGNGYRRGVPELPSTFSRLLEGDRLTIGRNTWQVIAGYGHAPEHASLYSAELGVLISGDMLLPKISTNVSVYAATPDDDPLGRFLDSLHRIKDLPRDTLVLPSHGRPFRGIPERVEELVEHHHLRCSALKSACIEARSACELLEILFARALDTHQVMFAMGEAIAHLNHLMTRGEITRLDGGDGVVRYKTTN